MVGLLEAATADLTIGLDLSGRAAGLVTLGTATLHFGSRDEGLATVITDGQGAHGRGRRRGRRGGQGD